MASSSSCPSAPAISSQSWKYHVFLSFRGEDTRKTFVDHLYTALEQQGIYTYKDDETLPRGNSIGPSLTKAIEESQIAVVIFSENYADSSWCLDELACIMKCKETKGQIVMPVFYDVDPSEVRKQKRKYGEAFAYHELENKKKIKSWRQAFVDDPWGWLSAPREQNRKYQEAFAKHELENKTKVESWRKALVDASNISGWEPQHIANGHESKVIKEIVDTISQRLKLLTSSANDNMVGIEARMQDLIPKLQIRVGGKSIIGIWGVGGIGKTTLASFIYDEISCKFEGSCFVKNIREESSKHGLEKLQEKILYGVLKQMQVPVIWRVEEGRIMIRDRLCHRKVLIVLDDVDHLDQLKALAGSHDWFGDGSRIIITTRDVHLLKAHKADAMHNIKLLNSDEAIELFRKLSPQNNRPKEDYERLSKEVVSYAGGLPLALTVLGSILCDKEIHEWRSALARLKKIPEADIMERLKISFDGLKPVEKDLFLDIACFHKGKNKMMAMEILDACGFHPVIGVKELIQKALITISHDMFGNEMFDMHDLVQEMGHYIVRGEHPNHPEKHSRVWKREDVLKICAMDAMTELDKIEVITTNYYSFRGQDLPPIVANMKNLRFIRWKGNPASPLLNNFPPRELCCLILHEGFQKQLWEGYKLLPSLKLMDLQDLHNLIMTPDFDGLPNLEKLMVASCRCLKEIHPSIGHLERLVFLSINSCWSLKTFPSIARLKKLETLEFFECPQLFKLPKIQQNMDQLPHLELESSGSTNCSVTCTDVKKPREDLIHHHSVLRLFPSSLIKLELSNCNVGDTNIGSAVWELPKLEELNLTGNKFSRLDFSLLRFPRLRWLDVSHCKRLVQLSKLPLSITVVNANFCTSLESIGDISNCKWVWNVSFKGKNKLGPLVGEVILDSMLEGNAIEVNFISVTLGHEMIPKGFVGRRLFWKNSCTLHLPHYWFKDFCGFLIYCVSEIESPYVNIIIKQEVDEDSQSKLWQKTEYGGKVNTYVGYVSFSSMRHTKSLSSAYNMISVSIDKRHMVIVGTSYVGAELVPRRSKGDEVQTTDCSEFWDKERENGNTFTIQHDSESSIKILWLPYYYTQKVVVKVDVHNREDTRKAVRILSRVPGVKSIGIGMLDEKLTVIGDVDPVDIVKKLRKRWHTDILSIGPAKKKEKVRWSY